MESPVLARPPGLGRFGENWPCGSGDCPEMDALGVACELLCSYVDRARLVDANPARIGSASVAGYHGGRLNPFETHPPRWGGRSSAWTARPVPSPRASRAIACRRAHDRCVYRSHPCSNRLARYPPRLAYHSRVTKENAVWREIHAVFAWCVPAARREPPGTRLDRRFPGDRVRPLSRAMGPVHGLADGRGAGRRARRPSRRRQSRLCRR